MPDLDLIKQVGQECGTGAGGSLRPVGQCRWPAPVATETTATAPADPFGDKAARV
jgi:hypothetical protein